MIRRKPLRADPEKVRAWQQKSRTRLKGSKLNPRSKKRAKQEKQYSGGGGEFLKEHPICPVTGEQSTQIHHSAKREGEWLNLRRYWIGVSQEGHRLIEDNKRVAETIKLMVRIREDYRTHVQGLLEHGESLTIPIFYESWDGKPLIKHFP